jgi:hypothetical protein
MRARVNLPYEPSPIIFRSYSRLFKTSYGRIFLESLPESVMTDRREDIGAFLKSTSPADLSDVGREN